MKNLKQIVDAVAVVLNDLLQFKLTKWKDAKVKAAEMNAAYENGVELDKGEILEDQFGKEIKVKRSMTPIRALLDRLMSIAVLAFLAWMLVKVVLAVGGIAFMFLAVGAALVGLTYVFDYFFGRPRKPAEATSDKQKPTADPQPAT